MSGTTTPVFGGLTIYRQDGVKQRRLRRRLVGLLTVALVVGSGAFVNALQADSAARGPNHAAASAAPFAYFPR